jgi:hypothetical protein
MAAVLPTLWEPQTSTVTHFVARNAVRCSLSLSPMILNPKTARRRCMALRAGAGMAAMLPIAPEYHTAAVRAAGATRPAVPKLCFLNVSMQPHEQNRNRTHLTG